MIIPFSPATPFSTSFAAVISVITAFSSFSFFPGTLHTQVLCEHHAHMSRTDAPCRLEILKALRGSAGTRTEFPCQICQF